MRTGKSILGLSVVGQADGAKLGTVRDLIFDTHSERVLGLVLAEKELFGLIEARVVPWSQVRSLGSDVVLVQNAIPSHKISDDAEIKQVVQRDAQDGRCDRATCLTGTRIHTSDGKLVGTMADLYIDEKDGGVLGYQVSSGFLNDTLRGKKFLAAADAMAVGKDSTVLAPADANLKDDNAKR